jgi:hypothetical protein
MMRMIRGTTVVILMRTVLLLLLLLKLLFLKLLQLLGGLRNGLLYLQQFHLFLYVPKIIVWTQSIVTA